MVKCSILHSLDLQNSFNGFSNNIRNNLLLIKNFVDNLYLNKSIIQSNSNYYKSIFDKGHSGILEKIFENQMNTKILVY